MSAKWIEGHGLCCPWVDVGRAMGALTQGRGQAGPGPAAAEPPPRTDFLGRELEASGVVPAAAPGSAPAPGHAGSAVSPRATSLGPDLSLRLSGPVPSVPSAQHDPRPLVEIPGPVAGGLPAGRREAELAKQWACRSLCPGRRRALGAAQPCPALAFAWAPSEGPSRGLVACRQVWSGWPRVRPPWWATSTPPQVRVPDAPAS